MTTPSLTRPHAILFDLDETLTDRLRSIAWWSEQFAQDYADRLGRAAAEGRQRRNEELREAVGGIDNRPKLRELVQARKPFSQLHARRQRSLIFPPPNGTGAHVHQARHAIL
jgi:hypothetical protein